MKADKKDQRKPGRPVANRKTALPGDDSQSVFQKMADQSQQVREGRIIQTKADQYNQRNGGGNTVTVQRNKTGLPDDLKSGIENLSGHSLDDVRVHRNSPNPAQLNAHAYAQGNQIHLAPGQEKHLPHEAWHVVQQKEGRVKPTIRLKGSVPVNNDSGLEKEADVMGDKAKGFSGMIRRKPATAQLSSSVIQRIPKNRHEYEEIYQYYQSAGRFNMLNPGAQNLINNLHDYSGQDDLDKPLFDDIKSAAHNADIIASLQSSAENKYDWKFIHDHLMSATADEAAEYGSFKSRWAGRAKKWLGTGSTLGIQASMQFVMQNQLSGYAFALRAVMNEVNLIINHAVKLSSKLSASKAYYRVAEGISLMQEGAKFIETHTKKGMFPEISWSTVSSYIKKFRAGIVAILKGVKAYKELDHKHGSVLNSVITHFNNIIGTIELVINLFTLPEEDRTAAVFNNLAKAIRHLLDYSILAISSLKSYYLNAQPGEEQPLIGPQHAVSDV